MTVHVLNIQLSLCSCIVIILSHVSFIHFVLPFIFSAKNKVLTVTVIAFVQHYVLFSCDVKKILILYT